MIKTISIYGHKSFHPTTAHAIRLDPTKTATYVYGLNGAGKSAIGEVVAGLARNDPKFAHCSIETTDNAKYRYLVYNHDYVDRLIGQPIQGIFTVGEIDTARQQRIQEIEASTGKLDGQITAGMASVQAAAGNIAKELVRAKDDIWKAHEWGRKTTLGPLLQGYGNNKEKFFQDLRTHMLPDDGKLDTVDRLEKRWADVSGTESERSRVSLDTSVIEQIERDPIWGEVAEVSSTSRLAPLVAKLGNADWVARGQGYMHTDQCPFCQQELPHDFRDELARLLEGERKAKVDRISSLVQAYAAHLEALDARAQAILLDPNAKDAGLDLAWSDMRATLHDTLTKLRGKEAQPSLEVVVEPVKTEALTSAVARLNALIDDFNTRVRDRKGERERIKAMFFQVMHAERAEAYARHDALLGPMRESFCRLRQSGRVRQSLRGFANGGHASVAERY